MITLLLAVLIIGSFIGCLCLYCVMKCTRKDSHRFMLDAQAMQHQNMAMPRQRDAIADAIESADTKSNGSHVLPRAEEPLQTLPNNQIMDTEECRFEETKGGAQTFKDDKDDEDDIEEHLK